MLQRVFRPEVDGAYGQITDLFVVFVGFQLHERHNHGAHGVADFQGALAADQNAYAVIFTGLEGLGHDIDAVHATHAVAVVDF